MSTVYRSVKWGEALLVEATKFPGGLSRAVENVRGEVGQNIGTRNTFAKLYEVEDPERLCGLDRYRAWLLLSALGLDPDGWDIPDTIVPRAIDPDKLQTELRDRRLRPMDYTSTHPRPRIARSRAEAWGTSEVPTNSDGYVSGAQIESVAA